MSYCEHPQGPCGRKATTWLRNKRTGKAIKVCSGCARGILAWDGRWERMD